MWFSLQSNVAELSKDMGHYVLFLVLLITDLLYKLIYKWGLRGVSFHSGGFNARHEQSRYQAVATSIFTNRF